MTAQQLIEDVYKLSGELDYLSPYDASDNFDISTSGAQIVLRALNNAVRQIATWKDRVARQHFRFFAFMEERYVQTSTTSETTAAGSTTTTVELSSTYTDDAFVGKVVGVEDEYRLVVASSGTTVTLADELSEAPSAGVSVTFHPRWVAISLSNEFVELLKVIDLADQNELLYRQKSSIPTDYEQVGTPSAWYRAGNRLYFDKPVEDSRWYRLVVYRLPDPMSEASDEPGLPPQYHHAVMIWTVAHAFGHSLEPTQRYSFLEEFREIMRSTQNSAEVGEVFTNDFQHEVEML